MTTDVDMGKIRRRVAQCFVRDGVFEIAVGWELVMLSGFIATGRFSILIIACITFVLTLPTFRKLLALRRTGYVALGNPFVAGGKKDALAILGAVAQYLSPGMGLTLAVTFGSLARRWGVVRFYLFALVSAVGGVVGLLIGPPPNIMFNSMPKITPIEIQLLSTAVAVEVSGVIALGRFLRSDPALEEDVSDGEG